MIKAIVFDCFGVLATDGLLPFREKYFGHDPALLEEAREFGRRCDAGLVSYDEMVIYLAGLARISEADARHQIEDNVPNEPLFALIRDELKPRYKIGMLSNAGDNWLPEIFAPEQIKLFDAVGLSYEVGIVKPDPRFYELIAERLGVQPGECVFVDDQERYCAGATDVGMHAIWYRDFAQLRRELAKITEVA